MSTTMTMFKKGHHFNKTAAVFNVIIGRTNGQNVLDVHSLHVNLRISV